MNDIDFEPREGALRAPKDAGSWFVANPGDRWYSTVTTIATHYFKDGEWCVIYDDLEIDELDFKTD